MMPRLKISISSVVILGLLILVSNQIVLTLFICLALTIHEVSHIVCSNLLGYQAIELKITMWGGDLVVNPLFEADPNAEILISLAGPVFNLVMAFGVMYLKFLGIQHDYLGYWQQINLLLGIINLIPVYPLDGGRIVHAWLTKLFGLKMATYYTRLVSVVVGGFFLISGLIQILIHHNGWFFIFVGCFVIGQTSYHAYIGKHTPRPNLFWQIGNHKTKLLRQGRFLNSKIVVVDSRTLLRLPLQHYGINEYLLFLIHDSPNKHDLISEEEAWAALYSKGYQATFQELLKLKA